MVEVNWAGWKPAGNKIREVTVSEYMGVIWATIRILSLTLSAVGNPWGLWATRGACIYLIYIFKRSLSSVWGFPGGASGKEPTCQCRRHNRQEFDPWVGKISWRRAWKPIPVFLPGESHGQRSLEGYSPWGRKELDTTEATEHARLLCDSKEAKIELGRMILKVKAGPSLVVRWLRLPLPLQGAQVRSLVRETRSHMLQWKSKNWSSQINKINYVFKKKVKSIILMTDGNVWTSMSGENRKSGTPFAKSMYLIACTPPSQK